MRDGAFWGNGGHGRKQKAEFESGAWLNFFIGFKLEPKRMDLEIGQFKTMDGWFVLGPKAEPQPGGGDGFHPGWGFVVSGAFLS